MGTTREATENMGIKPLEEKCKDNLSLRLRKSYIPAYKGRMHCMHNAIHFV